MITKLAPCLTLAPAISGCPTNPTQKAKTITTYVGPIQFQDQTLTHATATSHE